MKGSYEKRVAKDGAITWTCRVDVPGPDGKRKQRRLSAPTRRELEALVAKTLHQMASGAYVEPSRLTVGTYLAEHWLPAVEPTIRPGSALRYRQMVERHLTPGLGGLALAKVTPAHVQRYYADKLAAGLSPTTVNNQHAVLHRALDQAVRWRLLAVNPCDGADPPRRARLEMQTWTAEQVRCFLDGTAGEESHALYRLALLTGMRKGELLALRWDDIDLARGSLAVRRTLTRDGAGRWTMGEPKTAAGRRSIALPASCVAALRRHRADQSARRLKLGDAWRDAGLVFDDGAGSRLSPNVLDGRFHRAVRRLGLPRLRVHDLRHTAATLMLADGIHPKVAAERLGHSSVGMTLDRYSHVSGDMQRDAADRLDRLTGAS